VYLQKLPKWFKITCSLRLEIRGPTLCQNRRKWNVRKPECQKLLSQKICSWYTRSRSNTTAFERRTGSAPGPRWIHLFHFSPHVCLFGLPKKHVCMLATLRDQMSLDRANTQPASQRTASKNHFRQRAAADCALFRVPPGRPTFNQRPNPPGSRPVRHYGQSGLAVVGVVGSAIFLGYMRLNACKSMQPSVAYPCW